MIILCNFAAKIRIFFNVLIMERNFLEEEIPYEKMEKLGIGRTQLLKMPRDVLEPLMNGRITPLIMTHYKAENGKVISMPMKLQLVRDESGTVNLMTYQVRKEMERHIRNTYLRKIQAPLGAAPRLITWMQLV